MAEKRIQAATLCIPSLSVPAATLCISSGRAGQVHVTWLSPLGASASPAEISHALHTLLVLVSNQIKHPSDPRYHRMQAGRT